MHAGQPAVYQGIRNDRKVFDLNAADELGGRRRSGKRAIFPPWRTTRAATHHARAAAHDSLGDDDLDALSAKWSELVGDGRRISDQGARGRAVVPRFSRAWTPSLLACINRTRSLERAMSPLRQDWEAEAPHGRAACVNSSTTGISGRGLMT